MFLILCGELRVTEPADALSTRLHTQLWAIRADADRRQDRGLSPDCPKGACVCDGVWQEHVLGYLSPLLCQDPPQLKKMF